MAVAAPPPLELEQGAVSVLPARRVSTRPVVFTLSKARPARAPQQSVTYALPNVVGLPLRDALRQLYASGYHVEVEGNGIVSAVAEPRGNIVRVVASEVLP